MAFQSHILLFSLLILLLSLGISCQNSNTNISLGTILSPSTNGSSLLSPSGDFAFGFRALDTDPNLFLLAVYYYKITPRTVIWTANGGNPVPNGSKARLTSDGRLTLLDSSNLQIWSSNSGGASYGSMRDDGNFILYSSNSTIVWQTFDSPTDTILPGQVLNQNTSIFSKLTDDDYSEGRFKFVMQTDGNLVLYQVDFTTQTDQENNFYSTATQGNPNNTRLVFNKSGGNLYVLNIANGSTVEVLPEPVLTGENYLRATLDPDGGFRQYSFPKTQTSAGTWGIVANLVKDLCGLSFRVGSGICGFNSYCTLSDSGLTNCTCPPHYTFIDPTRKYKGCKIDYIPQSCEQGSESSFTFQAVRNLHFPLYAAEQLTPVNDAQCQEACLNDCFCMVAIYNNTGTCWKKRYPLSNGVLELQNVDRVAYIKYNKLNIGINESSSFISNDGPGKWRTTMLIVSSILVCSVGSNILHVCVCFRIHKQRKREGDSANTSRNIIVSVSATCSFTYKELEQATKGFSEELGKGAFGVVYKGVIPSQSNDNYTLTVAVKKLEQSLLEEGDQDFENEIASIGQTHHKNLVQLIGFCKEGSHRLIVFEFLSRGSLNKYIFGSNRPEWNQRIHIALGIANGLAYLHEQCRNQIIHCDIKPQNILLDDNMEARISDFGMAKLLGFDQTRTATGIRGTIGYFAPEWFKNVGISAKVDVYSFGVMLLQIICCKKRFEWGLESHERMTVVDWAKNCLENGRLDLLVEDDEEAKSDGSRLERFVMVGISCAEEDPWLRPKMKKVVHMLEGRTRSPSY